MFDAVTVDGRRLVVESSYPRVVALHGLALLRPRVGALSSERTKISYAPRAEFDVTARDVDLRRLNQHTTEVGEVARHAIPTELLERGGLPHNTVLGTLTAISHTAYSLFYPPMNTIEDVVAYFDSLGAQPVEKGIVCDNRFEVLDQHYTAAIPEGALRVAPPAGTPTNSFSEVAVGKVWIDRSDEGAQVVLETPELRVSMAPWPVKPGDEAPRNPSSREVDTIAGLYAAVTSASWR